MSERKLKKDSETNRTLLASARRTKKIYQFFAVIITTAFISSAVTLTISADGPTGFATVIEPGSMVETASYTVFQDSGVCYVKNGTTGGVDYSSTNASAVLQWTANTLNGNGKILVKAGTYILTYEVDIIGDLVQFWGEGPSTILQASAGFLGPSGGFCLIESNTGTYAHDIGFLTFDMASEPNVYGWHGESNSYGHRVHDCLFQNSVITPAGALDPSNSAQCKIFGNRFVDCAVGIGLSGTTLNYGHVIVGNDFDNCTYAIYGEYPYQTLISSNKMVVSMYGVYFWGSYNSIGGNIITGNSITLSGTTGGIGNAYGVRLDVTLGGALRTSTNANQSITNNFIWRSPDLTATVAYGIRLTNVTDTLISGNVFQMTGAGTNYGIYATKGSVIHISDNIFQDLHYGLSIDGATYVCVLRNSFITCLTRGYTQVPSTNSNYNLIDGNRFQGTNSHVRLGAGNDFATVTNNYFQGVSTPIVENTGNNLVKWNIGYVTEARGVKNITGAVDFVVFDHGLVTSALLVLVAPIQLGSGDFNVTASSTQITIYFENQPGAATWYFYWYAQTW